MKNLVKLVGLISLVSVIGFSFASYDNGSGNGDGGNAPSTNGRLTITGLEAYNGNYVVAEGGTENVYLFAAENVNWLQETFTGSRISNGSVTLKVWQVSETEELLSYSGNKWYYLD